MEGAFLPHLGCKVSRERVGIEVDGILAGKGDPETGLSLITTLKLWQVIFEQPLRGLCEANRDLMLPQGWDVRANVSFRAALKCAPYPPFEFVLYVGKRCSRALPTM